MFKFSDVCHYFKKDKEDHGRVAAIECMQMVRFSNNGVLTADVFKPNTEPFLFAKLKLRHGAPAATVLDPRRSVMMRSQRDQIDLFSEDVLRELGNIQFIVTDGFNKWGWITVMQWESSGKGLAHTAVYTLSCDPPEILRRMNQHDRRFIESHAAQLYV